MKILQQYINKNKLFCFFDSAEFEFGSEKPEYHNRYKALLMLDLVKKRSQSATSKKFFSIYIEAIRNETEPCSQELINYFTETTADEILQSIDLNLPKLIKQRRQDPLMKDLYCNNRTAFFLQIASEHNSVLKVFAVLNL